MTSVYCQIGNQLLRILCNTDSLSRGGACAFSQVTTDTPSPLHTQFQTYAQWYKGIGRILLGDNTGGWMGSCCGPSCSIKSSVYTLYIYIATSDHIYTQFDSDGPSFASVYSNSCTDWKTTKKKNFGENFGSWDLLVQNKKAWHILVKICQQFTVQCRYCEATRGAPGVAYTMVGIILATPPTPYPPGMGSRKISWSCYSPDWGLATYPPPRGWGLCCRRQWGEPTWRETVGEKWSGWPWQNCGDILCDNMYGSSQSQPTRNLPTNLLDGDQFLP